MSPKGLKALELERERILWDLSRSKDRAKMLVRLIDIDEELEKVARLCKRELECSSKSKIL